MIFSYPRYHFAPKKMSNFKTIEYYIFLSLLIIFIPVYLLSTSLFHLRSSLQPIKSRYPYLMIFVTLINLIYFIYTILLHLLQIYPCYINLWITYLFIIIFANS